jgi:hypothetical protein
MERDGALLARGGLALATRLGFTELLEDWLGSPATGEDFPAALPT